MSIKTNERGNCWWTLKELNLNGGEREIVSYYLRFKIIYRKYLMKKYLLIFSFIIFILSSIGAIYEASLGTSFGMFASICILLTIIGYFKYPSLISAWPASILVRAIIEIKSNEFNIFYNLGLLIAAIPLLILSLAIFDSKNKNRLKFFLTFVFIASVYFLIILMKDSLGQEMISFRFKPFCNVSKEWLSVRTIIKYEYNGTVKKNFYDFFCNSKTCSGVKIDLSESNLGFSSVSSVASLTRVA
jgi:hypothetical protein